VQATVASALGIEKSDVLCYVTLLGGGFGRKSKPDYVAEAALLSKQVGKPVKVVWSREDDSRFDYYHAVAAIYMRGRDISKQYLIRVQPHKYRAQSRYPNENPPWKHGSMGYGVRSLILSLCSDGYARGANSYRPSTSCFMAQVERPSCQARY
jgi:Molybdopterin-binding domain of aldehyde dehydrogenase